VIAAENRAEWLSGLFSAIDSKDTSLFLAYLSDDATFRFGSAPAVMGQETIGAAVEGFFQTIDGSSHKLLITLAESSTLVCEGEVTYKRLDGNSLTLPFANVFEMAGERISVYKIYIDIAPLYAA
jgi:limonene-1,2-epoxide hydrolase